MAANGRGQLRPNPGGRTPPFLVIGLLVVISILGYNYWTVSSKNASLNDEIQQLETRYSAVDRSKRDTEELAKKLTDDNGALQRQTKECEGRLSDQANTAAQTQGELRDKIDNVDRELEDTRRELMTCEDEAYSCTQNITATMLAHKKHLEDLSQRCHLDLEAERTKASQNMEQIQDSCKGMVDARRLSILRTVQTLFGSRAIELLSQNAQMDISGIDLSLGTNNAQAQNLAGGLLVGQQQPQQPLIQQQNLQTPDAAQGMPAQPINNLQPPQAIDDNQVEGQAQQIQDAPDNVEENKQADVNTNQVEAGNNEAEVDTNRAESENNQEEIITNQDQAEENPPAADDNNGDMANDSANQFNAQFNLSPETQAINQQQGSFYQVQNANNLQAINQPLLGQQPLIQQPVVQDPANQEAFQQSLDQQQFQQAEQPINPQFGDHGPAMFNQQLPSIDQPFQQPINQQFPGAYDQQQVQEGMNQEFVGQPQVQEPVNQPADTNEIPAIGAPGDQVVQREQSYQEYIDKQADAYQQYGDKRDADAYEEDNNKDEYDEEENRDGLVGQGVGLGGEDEYQQEVPALADERDMLEGQEPQDDRYQAPVGDNQPIVQYDMPQDQRLDQEQYVNQGMEQGLLIGAPSDTDTQGRLGEAVVQSGVRDSQLSLLLQALPKDTQKTPQLQHYLQTLIASEPESQRGHFSSMLGVPDSPGIPSQQSVYDTNNPTNPQTYNSLPLPADNNLVSAQTTNQLDSNTNLLHSNSLSAQSPQLDVALDQASSDVAGSLGTGYQSDNSPLLPPGGIFPADQSYQNSLLPPSDSQPLDQIGSDALLPPGGIFPSDESYKEYLQPPGATVPTDQSQNDPLLTSSDNLDSVDTNSNSLLARSDSIPLQQGYDDSLLPPGARDHDESRSPDAEPLDEAVNTVPKKQSHGFLFLNLTHLLQGASLDPYGEEDEDKTADGQTSEDAGDVDPETGDLILDGTTSHPGAADASTQSYGSSTQTLDDQFHHSTEAGGDPAQQDTEGEESKLASYQQVMDAFLHSQDPGLNVGGPPEDPQQDSLGAQSMTQLGTAQDQVDFSVGRS